MRRIAPVALGLLLVILPIPAAIAQPEPGPADPGEPEETNPEKPEKPTKGTAPVRQTVPFKDGMLHIPGGRFTMGLSDKAAPANERPARQISIPPFWIDKLEVSVGAYQACVARGVCARPPRTSALCTYDSGDPALPASCIPWGAAQTYCLAVGKRLPRESEWELTARGTSPIRYPWGGAGGSCGASATLAKENTDRSCSGRHPWKVGSHAGGASPFGALDMSGNVEEWVEDWYSDTVSEASPRAGASHVLRGGGWLSPPSAARTTSRNWGSVREAGPNVGFRCAKDD